MKSQLKSRESRWLSTVCSVVLLSLLSMSMQAQSQPGWNELQSTTSIFHKSLAVAPGSNVVFYGTLQGEIFKSTNFGDTWTQLAFTNGSQPVNDLFFISDVTGFAVSGNTIWKTTNGGTSWTSQTVGSGFEFNKIKFFGATGFAVGTGGKMYKSTDTGFTWTSVTTNTTTNINSLVITSSEVLVVGDQGLYRKYNLSSGSWTNQDKGVSLYDVKVINNKYVAVGASGGILVDGVGKTSGTTATLKSVVSAGNFGVFISGTNGVIIKSTAALLDTWSSSATGKTSELSQLVSGMATNDAILALGASFIMRSFNGGVCQAPTVVTQQVPISVCAGGSISITAENTGTAASWQWRKNGVNVANATKKTLTISGATTAHAGNYDVVVSSPCGNATSNAVAVTVNTTPTPSSIVGPGTTSVGISNTYSVSAIAGATFNWSAGANGTVTGSGNSVQMSWSEGGVKTITVTATDACGTSAQKTLSISVGNCTLPSQPAFSVTPPATGCVSQSSNFSVTAVAGVSYAWTISGGGTITGSGNSALVNWTSAGSHTVTVTPSNACGNGTARTASVTVSGLPSQPSTITGNTTMCTGASTTYSVTSVAGVTYSWDTGGAGTVTGSGNSVSVTWTSAGARTLTVTPSTSCGVGTARSLAVTVNAVPAQPSVLAGSNSVTINTSNQYSITNETGVTYTWSAGSGGTITGSGNSVNIIWSTTGSKTITVTPSNTCGNGTARTLNVTVNDCAVPAQPSIINGTTAMCANVSSAYSVTSVGGVSYTWNPGTDGVVSGTGNLVDIMWSSAGSKTITVTPYNACGNGTARTLNVTVSGLPSQPSTITGLTTACKDAATTYNITSVGGVSYTWDAGGKGTFTGGGNSVSVTWTTTGTNTLTVTPSNSCGNGTARTLSVTVNKIPDPAGAISGSADVCMSTGKAYSVTNVGGVTYTWNAGTNGTFDGGATASGNIIWSSGGTKSVTVTPSNSCGSATASTLSVNVTAIPSQPSAITGNTSALVGDLNSYSVSNVAGVTYSWSGGSGSTVSGSGNEAQISWSTTGSKTVSVTASNYCGTSTTRSTTVNVSVANCTATAAPTFSGSVSQGAPSVGYNYSVNTVSGASSYIFSVTPSTGVNITGSGTSRTITYPSAGSYSVSVVAVKDCGGGQFVNSTPVTLSVLICTINPPAPTGLTGPTTVCRTTTSRYTVDVLPNFTYEFWLSNSAYGTITNVANGVVDITWADGFNEPGVTLEARGQTTCGSYTDGNASLSISIKAQPQTTGIYNSSPQNPQCDGSTVNLGLDNAVGGTTYTWDLGGAGTVAGDNLTASFQIYTSRTVKVYGTNTCATTKFLGSKTFTSTPLAKQPSPISGPATVDLFPSLGTYSVESQGSEVLTNWNVGSFGSAFPNGNEFSRDAGWDTPGAQTITVYAYNGCGNSATRTTTITVLPPCTQPVMPESITGPTSGCVGVEYTFSVPYQEGVTYNWSAGANATITGSGNTRVIKWTAGGVRTISVSATKSCGTSAEQTLSFTVNSSPAQPGSITGGSLACSGSVENFSVSPVAGVTYTWEVTGGTFTNSGTQNENIAVTWTSAGSNSISVKASNSCGFSAAQTLARTVSTVPAQPSLITGEAEVCSSTSKAYNITNVSGVTYTWNGGTGGTVTGSGNAVNISWSSTGAKSVTVTPSNSCGNGTARTLSVTVIGVPAQPSTISGTLTPTLGNSEAYSITSVAGVNYAWSLSDKGALSGSGNNSSVLWNATGSSTLTVTPSNACGNGTARTASITISKISQTISFTLPTPVSANQEVVFNGTSTSGLPVAYTSSNNSIAEVVGVQLVIKASGSINITASQAGDASFNAASNVVQPLTINKANQTITFNTLVSRTFGSGDFELEATTTSGLPISYSSSNTAVATVNGNTITIVGAGSTNITASQGGDAIYNSATPVVRALTVNKADQTILFEPLAAVSISDPPFSLTATASSGLAVSYSSSNTAVATVSGSTVTIVGQGNATITASQPGNTNYNAASNVQQTLTVISQTRTIALSGNLTFGEVVIGVPKQAVLTINNSGNSLLTISNITYPAGFSGATSGTVASGASLEVSVTFDPSEAISYSGDILVTSDATGGSNQFAVSGSGVLITSADSPILTVDEVYPNPVRNELTIEVTGLDHAKVKEVFFYDMSGRTFSMKVEQTFENGKYRCNVEGLKEGIYMLALPGQKSVKRIMKTN